MTGGTSDHTSVHSIRSDKLTLKPVREAIACEASLPADDLASDSVQLQLNPLTPESGLSALLTEAHLPRGLGVDAEVGGDLHGAPHALGDITEAAV